MTQKFVMYSPLCRLEQEFQRQGLKEPDRTSASKSYMWLHRTSGCAEQPLVLYEYQPSRKAEHAKPAVSQQRGSRLERRSSGMRELCRIRRSEGYGACDDEGPCQAKI